MSRHVLGIAIGSKNPPMTFDGTVTLGSILQIVSMVILAVALFNAMAARMTVFENSLKDHAGRLDRHEDTILDLVKNIHSLLGHTPRDRR